MDELIARIQARVADPVCAREAAAWVRPIRPDDVAPPATVGRGRGGARIPPPAAAAAALRRGGERRLGTGQRAGRHPDRGVRAERDRHRRLHLADDGPERPLESPAVEWPPGVVPLINSRRLEVCDFLRSPYPVFELDAELWDLEGPVREYLTPVAASLADRLEAWLAG